MCVLCLCVFLRWQTPLPFPLLGTADEAEKRMGPVPSPLGRVTTFRLSFKRRVDGPPAAETTSPVGVNGIILISC